MLKSSRRSRTLQLVALAAITVAIAAGIAPELHQAQAHGSRHCGASRGHRSAKDLIVQHIDLIKAGKLDEAMCDYDDDAVVILPGQTITGLDNIRQGLSGIGSLLGGVWPEVQTITATDSVVMITFAAFGVPCTIPDGSDTYVIERGRIVTQTVHDTLHSAPGAVCPAAAPGQ